MRIWLLVVFGMITAIVAVGGITRLTGSGLSMVEWRPLMGALPPLTEAEWTRVFTKYQASPQYQHVNDWMTLADFQRIFFWEWFHRLIGRLIGVAFFVPWLVFLLRGRLQGRLRLRTFVAFVLGGLQGLLGWFMVKSGLVDIPQVSHFRLAAHLSLAFTVASYVLWLWMDLRWPANTEPKDPGARPFARWLVPFVALVGLQIVYGAFMAGSRAGYLFATWPDMNGHYLPGALLSAASDASWLSHPVLIHFLHRTLGYGVAVAALALFLVGRRRVAAPRARRGLLLVLVATGAQVLLGILTVVLKVELVTAVVHQLGAFALLSVALFTLHALRRA
ncbi:MAG: COX15/CtaA family protein [Deltaproteobacteria bacterium]|nr:COX15/CtaA family protein [Deltaproteobacteria bacterium]